MGKRKIDPDERARWVEARRRLAETLARSERIVEERRAAELRRRARLRRLSFGLLGR